MNLAEEFTLLAYQDDGSPEIDGTRLDHGAGGAVLLELALAGRVEVADKRVAVIDPTPTGDPLIDRALSEIGASKPRKPDAWVQRFAKGTREQVLESLVAAEVLRKEQGKVLLVFPRTKYVAAHGVEPVAETEARQRLVGAISAAGEVEPRTAALCSLVAATGLDRKVFARLERKQVKARLKQISGGAWAATAVKKSIEAVETAVLVSIIAATTASTTATVTN
jgi:hypothetical protein